MPPIKLPATQLRTIIGMLFTDSDLAPLFGDLCDLLEGKFDPWDMVNKLELRFYAGDEEFEFEDWLINAGQFAVIVKSYINTNPQANVSEIDRLCTWFQDALLAARDDLHDEELHNYYGFMAQAEFVRLYANTDMNQEFIDAFRERFSKIIDEVEAISYGERGSAVALLTNQIVDALKWRPEQLQFLLLDLDRLMDIVDEDPVERDEVLGSCVRAFAFVDYETRSPEEQFVWAKNRLGTIRDPFTRVSAAANVAVGHALRGEKEEAAELLADEVEKAAGLLSPKKELYTAFLARGAIEAGLRETDVYEQLVADVDETLERIMAHVRELSEELAKLDDKTQEETKEEDDRRVEEIAASFESEFVMLHGDLDNLALAGMHTSEVKWLLQVEAIIENVQEINLSLAFKPKLAVYYQLFKNPVHVKDKPATLLDEVMTTLDQEVEHMITEDLFEFFLDFCKDCLELAALSGDDVFIEHLEKAFTTIKDRKNLDEDDAETMRWQVLSGINYVMELIWNQKMGTGAVRHAAEKKSENYE
jgi:hypothetical protein